MYVYVLQCAALMYIRVYHIDEFLIMTSSASLLIVTSHNYKAYWYSYMYGAISR